MGSSGCNCQGGGVVVIAKRLSNREDQVNDEQTKTNIHNLMIFWTMIDDISPSFNHQTYPIVSIERTIHHQRSLDNPDVVQISSAHQKSTYYPKLDPMLMIFTPDCCCCSWHYVIVKINTSYNVLVCSKYLLSLIILRLLLMLASLTVNDSYC